MAEKKAEREDKEGEEGAESQEAKPKSKKKLIIIVAVVVVLLVVVVAFLALGGKKAPAEGEEGVVEEEHDAPAQHAELGTFIVNLSDNASFLKVRITVEFHEAKHGEGGGGHGGEGAGKSDLPEPFGSREPIVRDAIIRVMSSKRAEDVLNVEGKEELREELIDALNEALQADAVTALYFQEFIIQ